jgi:hypothetical protein
VLLCATDSPSSNHAQASHRRTFARTAPHFPGLILLEIGLVLLLVAVIYNAGVAAHHGFDSSLLEQPVAVLGACAGLVSAVAGLVTALTGLIKVF